MGSDSDNFVSKVVRKTHCVPRVGDHGLAGDRGCERAESGLTRDLQEIRRFPMLERNEEYMLAQRWRGHGDREAAHKLVTSHLRLVAKIAMGFRGYNLPISEAISEGNVGLMQALERFEPEKAFRLSTSPPSCINASIPQYI